MKSFLNTIRAKAGLHRASLKKAGVLLLSTLVIAAITAIITTQVEWKNDVRLLVKQDQGARLSAFRDTGRGMYVALAGLNEALAEDKSLDAPRSRMREAIAQHSATVIECVDIFGQSAVTGYQLELSRLRAATDKAVSAEDAMDLQQIALDLLSKRQHMLSRGSRSISD